MNSDAFSKRVLGPLVVASVLVVLFFAGGLVWAGLAPLATTLQVPGAISTANPGVEIQHPTGGRIARVAIQPLQDVAKGALLFELDTAEQNIALAAVTAQIAIIEAQQHELAARLNQAPTGVKRPDVAQEFAAEDAYHEGRLSDLTAAAAEGQARHMGLLSERAALVAAQDLALAREVDLSALVARGVAAKQVLRDHQAQVLSLEAQISALDAEISQVVGSIAQTQRAIPLARAERKAELHNRFRLNATQLGDMHQQADVLRHRVAHSRIYAPFDGRITELPFDAAGLVAPPGGTLAVMTRPLTAPVLELKIPAQNIDQIAPGAEGTLMITGLPARMMPRLRVSLTEVALASSVDPADGTPFYRARAQINPADLEAARAALGARFQLVIDMPVMAMISGEEITPLEYFLDPLLHLWRGAFEA